MARYKGPLFKKSRRYQFSILENDNEFNKNKGRSSVPGQHGQNRQSKLSDYGLHLREKQKVKFTYGVNERQFVNTFKKAKKIKGVVGVNFLIRLESRLDNLVYRLGFANTRRQARQLVNHNHFLVDGKKANIPSMIIKIGQKIEVKPKSKEVKIINLNLETRPIAPWLTRKDFAGIYERYPERQELNPNIDEGLIVEFYSR